MKNILLIIFAIVNFTALGQKRELNVGFWNVQNLFDTINDAGVSDGQFTPIGQKKWDGNKYNQKVKMLSEVIKRMELDFLGVCEVENRGVLEDLNIKMGKPYNIVHYNSCDVRGIDQAILYDTAKMQLIESGLIPTATDKPKRELLYSKFSIGKDIIIFYVVHLPSKLGGERAQMNRQLIVKQIDSLVGVAKYDVVIMGDMNDDPITVKKTTNKAKTLQENGLGSYTYKGYASMLDQILITDGINCSEIELINVEATSQFGRKRRASDHKAIKINLLFK